MQKYVICIIAFMMLVGLASAAGNDSELMKPGMGCAWLEQQGADVQELLNFVLGALVVVTIVAYVIFTGKAGIGIMANISSTLYIQGDPATNAVVRGSARIWLQPPGINIELTQSISVKQVGDNIIATLHAQCH